MAVNEDLSAYSTTAASNTPGGTTNIGTDLDDHLRDIKKNVRIVGTSFPSISSPANVLGRTWLDTSGSASAIAIWKMGDGTDFIQLFEIDTSANTAFASADPANFASTGTTLTAEKGLSGGGALTANRSIGMANLHTATATFTNATVSRNEYGIITAISTGDSPSGVATNAQVQDRSATGVYVSPANAKHHLGVAKFFVIFDGSGTASLAASYNVDSVVRSAAGKYTINLNTGFTNTNYVVNALVNDENTAHHTIVVDSMTASIVSLVHGRSDSFSKTDATRIMVVGYGFHAT